MTTTMTLATVLHCSPFEIFAQDCDEVIMLINYYMMKKSNEKAESPKPKITRVPGKEERIRVNDKTATNGWY